MTNLEILYGYWEECLRQARFFAKYTDNTIAIEGLRNMAFGSLNLFSRLTWKDCPEEEAEALSSWDNLYSPQFEECLSVITKNQKKD